MKIAIDAGHGPNTPGKRSPDGSLREFQFNSAVAKYLISLLHEYEGIETFSVFADDVDVPLFMRTNIANDRKADLYLSIHANASGDTWSDAEGIETYIYATGGIAEEVAKTIHPILVARTKRKDRGVRVANFHVLRETKMPAFLFECDFMTNKQEVKLLKSDEYRMNVAEAIAEGVGAYYHLKKKEVPKVEQKQEVSAWAKEAQKWVKEKGISDGERPKDTVTREEVWTMLYRMAKPGN